MEQAFDVPEKVTKVALENVADVLERGPGLRYSMGIFVIAKDTKNREVLLGGLGSFGVGQMWFGITEYNRQYEGFDDAPDIDTETHGARLNYWTGKVDVYEKKIACYQVGDKEYIASVK